MGEINIRKPAINLSRTVFVCALILVWNNVETVKVEFNLENYLENSDTQVPMPRSNANRSTSVPLKIGQYVEIPFCLPVEAKINIEEMSYSNDGQSDKITIFIDDDLVGSFQTKEHSDWGHKWNEFLPTGPIGDPKTLPPGFHKILISVNESDVYGVELDTIQLKADIPGFDDVEFLRCEKCLEQVVSPDIGGGDKPNPGNVSNGSVLTLQNLGLVPSEDGINSVVVVMIPRPMVPYRVQAVPPWYTVRSEFESTTKAPGPVVVGQDIWKIGTDDKSSDEFADQELIGNVGRDAFNIGTPNSSFLGSFNSSSVDRFKITFDGREFLSLFEEGVTSSFVEIVLAAPQLPVNISVQSMSSPEDFSPPLFKHFTSFSPTHNWEFPVSTWSSSAQNSIEISVDSLEPTNVQIDFVRMYIGKRAFSDYLLVRNTQHLIVEVRSKDPGRPGKSAMTVTGIQDEPIEGAGVIEISIRGNGSQELVPVFQLQWDGSITITSPLLGEFPPADQRSIFKLAPYLTGIKNVDVDSTDMTFNITFTDDSMARLRVDATRETAEFTVLDTDIVTCDGPFISLQTPWTSDADNGADTIVTNGRDVNQLLTGWETLEATTIDFVNRCGSNDGITGPDWKIELLE